jgi:hypothetical protein
VSESSDTGTTQNSGTSLSTPLVASAVACLIQAHPDWTVDQMRRYLLYTAKDYVANHTYDPNYVRGYGIIDALAASAGDCNANLVPDATDIANATSRDCNTNGIPDECDIADGRSLDANGNGMPKVWVEAAPTGGIALLYYYPRAETDQNGKFIIKGMGANDYLVYPIQSQYHHLNKAGTDRLVKPASHGHG